MKALIRNTRAYRLASFVRGYLGWGKWAKRQFAAPSPKFIKQACLIRNGIPNAIWVETGTYVGDTTHLLSKHAAKVYSIEPGSTLFSNAERRFRSYENVEILNGLSEDILPGLLPNINGDVNFWLDGHYSAGVTFRGPKDTPIVDELECIRKNLSHFNKIAVLIDDIRSFDPNENECSAYPPLDFLVDWARENNFAWYIEHDIFVAKNLGRFEKAA